MSTGLHNIALPKLKWAHKDPRTKPSDLSPEPEPIDPNQAQLARGVAVRADESSGKTWNLRPRKPVSAPPPPRQTNEAANSGGRVQRNIERREKKTDKLFISLTKEEIAEDLYSMTGSMPSRRPKKRTRVVQQLVDKVFPGLNLDGTNPDSYRDQRFPFKGLEMLVL